MHKQRLVTKFSDEQIGEIRWLLVKAWDSDAGHGTMREDLFWNFYCATTACLLIRVNERRSSLLRVISARDAIWAHRREAYAKARWRELDTAVGKAIAKWSAWS